jgi:hypothetical protein
MPQGEPISHAEMIAAVKRIVRWLHDPTSLGPYRPSEDRPAFLTVLAHLERTQWRPIEEAPKHRDKIIDVWLGDASAADVEFYCNPGTRCSCGWHWLDGKFRPCVGGLHLPVFVVPTHFMLPPLPPSPETPR